MTKGSGKDQSIVPCQSPDHSSRCGKYGVEYKPCHDNTGYSHGDSAGIGPEGDASQFERQVAVRMFLSAGLRPHDVRERNKPIDSQKLLEV